VGDEVLGFALATHATHFGGDKMKWLKEHMAAIDWSNCEDLKETVEAYCPPGCEDKA
jgi:hypothetical protein